MNGRDVNANQINKSMSKIHLFLSKTSKCSDHFKKKRRIRIRTPISDFNQFSKDTSETNRTNYGVKKIENPKRNHERCNVSAIECIVPISSCIENRKFHKCISCCVSLPFQFNLGTYSSTSFDRNSHSIFRLNFCALLLMRWRARARATAQQQNHQSE